MGEIRSVQVFAGTVVSTSSEFDGQQSPATLTLIEHDSEYEARFVFFVGGPVALTVFVPKAASNTLKGIVEDPRGWDVSFSVELHGDRVTGSYNQPYDRGTFELEAV